MRPCTNKQTNKQKTKTKKTNKKTPKATMKETVPATTINDARRKNWGEKNAIGEQTKAVMEKILGSR
jgi:hypothetical protein